MEVFKEKAYIIEINTDGFSSFMLLIIAIVAPRQVFEQWKSQCSKTGKILHKQHKNS